MPYTIELKIKNNKKNNPLSVEISRKIYEPYLPTYINPDNDYIKENETGISVNITYDNVKIDVPDLTDAKDQTPLNVNIYANYGTFPDSFDKTAKPGDRVSLPDPIEDNAEFLGWYYDKDFKYPVQDEYIIGSGEHLGGALYINYVFAKWKTRPVKLELNGGKLLVDVPFYQYLMQYNQIEPVKENYQFAGWYLDSNFENKVPNNIDDGPITQEYTLYAKWTPLVKITLSAGVDYKIINLVGRAGDLIIYPGDENIFKQGKIFYKWCADRGLIQDAPATFPAQNTTVYAQYVDAYCVTFKGFEGKDYFYKYFNLPKDDNNFSKYYVDMSRYMLDTFDKDKDQTIFSGWYLDSALTQPFEQYPSSDISLYPKFTAPVYIKFNLGDGTSFEDYLSGEFMVQYEKINHFGLPYTQWLAIMNSYVQAPAGRVFNGWYTNPSRTIPYIATDWPAQSITLYAGYSDS